MYTSCSELRMHGLTQASFTRQCFNQKELRFMLVFNVRLHGDSENDHKNAID